jgi:hypothetical protein
MMVYKGSGCKAPLILTVGTNLKFVMSLALRSLYALERAASTQWLGVWLGPKAGLDCFKEKINLLLLPGFETRILQPVPY